MYLFVFVFLILSVMGIYTELVSLRVAQMAAKQSAVAETMMLWHGAEYEFIKNPIVPAASFVSECSLTPTFGVPCSVAAVDYQLPDYTVAPLAIYGARNYLPVGYDYTLQWQTMYYVDAASSYILTFMDSAERKLGYSAEEVFRQLKNTSIPKIYYGRVGAGPCIGGAAVGDFLITNEFINGVQVCYPVPASVGTGSIGIISVISS